MKIINQTNVEHLVIALSHQILIGAIFGNYWVGFAYGSALFVGREFAQAEARVLFMNGWRSFDDAHSLGKYPELMAYNPKYWTLDSFMDMALPFTGTLIVALTVEYVL